MGKKNKNKNRPPAETQIAPQNIACLPSSKLKNWDLWPRELYEQINPQNTQSAVEIVTNCVNFFIKKISQSYLQPIDYRLFDWFILLNAQEHQQAIKILEQFRNQRKHTIANKDKLNRYFIAPLRARHLLFDEKGQLLSLSSETDIEKIHKILQAEQAFQSESNTPKNKIRAHLISRASHLVYLFYYGSKELLEKILLKMQIMHLFFSEKVKVDNSHIKLFELLKKQVDQLKNQSQLDYTLQLGRLLSTQTSDDEVLYTIIETIENLNQNIDGTTAQLASFKEELTEVLLDYKNKQRINCSQTSFLKNADYQALKQTINNIIPSKKKSSRARQKQTVYQQIQALHQKSGWPKDLCDYLYDIFSRNFFYKNKKVLPDLDTLCIEHFTRQEKYGAVFSTLPEKTQIHIKARSQGINEEEKILLIQLILYTQDKESIEFIPYYNALYREAVQKNYLIVQNEIEHTIQKLTTIEKTSLPITIKELDEHLLLLLMQNRSYHEWLQQNNHLSLYGSDDLYKKIKKLEWPKELSKAIKQKMTALKDSYHPLNLVDFSMKHFIQLLKNRSKDLKIVYQQFISWLDCLTPSEQDSALKACHDHEKTLETRSKDDFNHYITQAIGAKKLLSTTCCAPETSLDKTKYHNEQEITEADLRALLQHHRSTLLTKALSTKQIDLYLNRWARDWLYLLSNNKQAALKQALIESEIFVTTTQKTSVLRAVAPKKSQPVQRTVIGLLGKYIAEIKATIKKSPKIKIENDQLLKLFVNIQALFLELLKDTLTPTSIERMVQLIYFDAIPLSINHRTRKLQHQLAMILVDLPDKMRVISCLQAVSGKNLQYFLAQNKITFIDCLKQPGLFKKWWHNQSRLTNEELVQLMAEHPIEAVDILQDAHYGKQLVPHKNPTTLFSLFTKIKDRVTADSKKFNDYYPLLLKVIASYNQLNAKENQSQKLELQWFFEQTLQHHTTQENWKKIFNTAQLNIFQSITERSNVIEKSPIEQSSSKRRSGIRDHSTPDSATLHPGYVEDDASDKMPRMVR